MSIESRFLPYKEIKEGSPDSHVLCRRLTPDALEQLKGQLGKPVYVKFVNESWIYEGASEEDHSVDETQSHGILINVNERAIGVDVIIAGEIQPYHGGIIQLRKTYREFPFYEKQFDLKRSAYVSQIHTLAVGDKTYQLGGNASDTEKRETSVGEFLKIIEKDLIKPTRKYHIGWDNGEEIQACHALTIEVEEGDDPREVAHRFLKDYEVFHILEFVEEVEPGKTYLNF